MRRHSYETANGLLGAARELGLGQECFHQLPGARALRVLDEVFDAFCVSGRGDRMRRWLWNDLRAPSAFPPGSHDLDLLNRLGSPLAPVWLVAEESSSPKHGPPFWIFEATLSAASETLANYHLLEFYVVGRAMTWLCGENHHGGWFVAGDHAISACQDLLSRDALLSSEPGVLGAHGWRLPSITRHRVKKNDSSD